MKEMEREREEKEKAVDELKKELQETQEAVRPYTV